MVSGLIIIPDCNKYNHAESDQPEFGYWGSVSWCRRLLSCNNQVSHPQGELPTRKGRENASGRDFYGPGSLEVKTRASCHDPLLNIGLPGTKVPVSRVIHRAERVLPLPTSRAIMSAVK